MKIFKNTVIPKRYKRSALAIGNFDGVHKGHQKVFNEAKKYAKEALSHNGKYASAAYELGMAEMHLCNKAAARDAFNKAKRDSIDLKIISGTRNFYEQKAIWNRKWNLYNNLNPIHRAKKILEYSSMPSTSRHHWGTDIDLNSLNNSYFNTGKGLKTYQWLKIPRSL